METLFNYLLIPVDTSLYNDIVSVDKYGNKFIDLTKQTTVDALMPYLHNDEINLSRFMYSIFGDFVCVKYYMSYHKKVPSSLNITTMKIDM